MADKIEQREVGVKYPDLVLFGPPGCGKETQGNILIEKFGYVRISTGNICREHVKAQTPLGLVAQEYMYAGELVPDKIIIQMFQEEFKKIPGDASPLIDGFPRTEDQRQLFHEMMTKEGRDYEVVALTANTEDEEKALVERLVERAKTSGRTDDADPDVIRNRLKVYNEKTGVVLDRWKAENKNIHKHSAIGEILGISEWIQKEVVEKYSQRVKDVLDQEIS